MPSEDEPMRGWGFGNIGYWGCKVEYISLGGYIIYPDVDIFSN